MLGECPDEKSAGELGNHSYIAYLTVDELDQLYQEVAARGAQVISTTWKRTMGHEGV